MKKIKHILLIFLLHFMNQNAYAAVENPVYEWLKNDSTKMVDMIYFDHHIYTLGDNLKKWDTSGNLIWMKPISGIDLDIDNNGNLVLANNFNTPNITIANTTLLNNGGYDFYIAKVDTAGNVIWAKSYGGTDTDKSRQICVDYENSIYIHCHYQNIKGILKLSDAGNIIWSKNINGGDYAGDRELIYSGVDSTVVLIGLFTGMFQIDTFVLWYTPSGVWGPAQDIYAAKFDKNGNTVYLNKITYTYRTDRKLGKSYINQKNGNLFICIATDGLAQVYAKIEEFDKNATFIKLHMIPPDLNGNDVWSDEIFSVWGNNDSLIASFWYNYHELVIKNTFSNPINNYTKEYNYYQYFGQNYINCFIWNKDKQYIQFGLYNFAKFGDTSLPLSIFNVHDDTVCPDVYFNTGYVINSGKPPYTVSWSPTIGLGNPNVLNPGFYLDTTTTYIITLTDSNNTVIHDTVTFTVYPTPHDSITVTGNPIFCYGSTDSIQLSCNLPGFVNKWTSNVLGVVATDTSIIWAHPNNIYTLTTTDTTSGCYSTDAINLNFYNKQAILVDTSLTEYGDSLVKCNSTDSLLLKNKNATIPTSRLTWYRNGVLIDSNKQSIKIGSTGQYVLKNTDIYCVNADTLNVIYSYISIAAHASDTSICKGDSVLVYGSGALNYIWNNGVVDSIPFSPANTKSYTAISTDAYNCTSSSIINVKVNNPFYQSSTHYKCQGADITFPDGFTVSNLSFDIVHISSFQTVAGCDSIYTDTVVVSGSYIIHTPLYGCAGAEFTLQNGNLIQVYNDTSLVFYFYTFGTGCDSTIYKDIHIITEIDSTLTVHRNYFEANELNATYQWLDCDDNNTYIPGEISRICSPKTKGNYAVQINKSGCIVNSACYRIYVQDNSEVYAAIYPNPASNTFIVDYSTQTDARLILFNSVGQTVLETILPADKNKLEINIKNITTGLYHYHIDMHERKSYMGKLLIR